MKKSIIAGVVAAIIVLLAPSSLYTVQKAQFAAVSQFGKIVKVVEDPGLKIKVPFIQNVQKVSAKTMLYDVPLSDVITKDKKSMIADCYVLWKVKDPAKYIRTLDAIPQRAMERIEAAVYNALKSVISSMTQDDIIAARGERLTGLLTDESNSDIGDYGIMVLTAEIKALDLPDDNKAAVYERMISERENIAASYTAAGEAEAKKIRNAADKEAAVLKAEAAKKAQVLLADGESQYMQILSEAYGTQDKAEFYAFLRGLDALKASLQGGNKTIILGKDSELARILYGIG